MKRNGINKFEGHPGKLHWRRRQNVSFLLRLRFFFLFFSSLFLHREFEFVCHTQFFSGMHAAHCDADECIFGDMGSDPNNDYVLIIVTIMTNVDND